MILSYNGIELQLVDFVRRERSLVYDTRGRDVIYVKHVIGAVCTYSQGGWPTGTEVRTVQPETIADAKQTKSIPNTLVTTPSNNPTPNLRNNVAGAQNQIGVSPTLTDIELRTRLFIPRKQLSITAWDTDGSQIIWLQSPAPGAKSDVSGGPYPRAVDIIQSSGEPNSIGVYFEIETDLTPCHTGEDQAVLAHSWQMTHTHDEDFYLTRIITGEVVFNQAVLDANGVNPDWLRQQFFHPIPLGYKRGLPEVTISPDGNTIRYVITDTDPTVVFDPADTGATRMDIVEEMTMSVPLDIGGRQDGRRSKDLTDLLSPAWSALKSIF